MRIELTTSRRVANDELDTLAPGVYALDVPAKVGEYYDVCIHETYRCAQRLVARIGPPGPHQPLSFRTRADGNRVITAWTAAKYLPCPFTPLSNGVLVRQLEYPDRPAHSFLEIPEAFRKEYLRSSRTHEVVTQGEVVAVGNGHLIKKGPRAGERIALIPQSGERVLFVPTEPNDKIVVDGEELWVVHENHILGIIDSEF